MPSGAYLMRLAGDGHVEELPFYVRPSRGRQEADVLFIASTYTYQAYANHARGNSDAAFRERVAAWGAYPHNPDDHPEYGRSTYNRHRDGSGICYSSRLRPVLTLRPRYLTFLDARGSGLRHYSADTHLLDWLEGQGIAFDVVTDEDVDAEGAALLPPTESCSRARIPSTTPCAPTTRTRAISRAGGGSSIWAATASTGASHQPGLARRHRGSPRRDRHPRVGGAGRRVLPRPRRHVRRPVAAQWATAPAARRRGFLRAGALRGSYYRRQPGADDPRAAWILAGVDEAVIGDFGLSGGGAAGFEVDRADAALGTPAGAIVVASSEGHGPSFVVVFEDLLSHLASATGERPSRMIRADMTYAELPGGGAIFAVGSITFCGSLSHNRYDNNVSRILRNVIERFRKPR
jgi:hypothetical protein